MQRMLKFLAEVIHDPLVQWGYAREGYTRSTCSNGVIHERIIHEELCSTRVINEGLYKNHSLNWGGGGGVIHGGL